MSAKKSKPVKKAKPAKAKPSKKEKVKAKVAASKKAPSKKTIASKSKNTKSKPSPKKALAKPVKKVTKPVKTSVKAKSSAKVALKKVVKKDKKIAKTPPVKKSAAQEKDIVKSKQKQVSKEKPKPLKKADKPAKQDKAKAQEGIEISKAKVAKATTSKRGRKKKGSGDDEEEPSIDVNDALINEILETVKPKKGPKQPKQIRTFVNPMSSLTVAKAVKEAKKNKVKEPKGKFELEYVIGTSPGILYEFLTTPSGLSEWFADDVNIHDGVFTFVWDGTDQKALLLDFKEDKFIRFQWLDKPEGSYFEFRIDIDELTGDVSLIVTDFADEGSDFQTSKLLWDSQVHTLMHVIGSY